MGSPLGPTPATHFYAILKMNGWLIVQSPLNL